MRDSDIRAFLVELYEKGTQNDAQTQERSKKMLNLEPDTAQFLHILLKSTRRARLLEIGTSNGYSTIWLAWAVAANGGQVISIDRDANKQALADANLRHVGLRDVVDLRCGDATEIVAGLAGPFDCVFFDADRYSAPAQLKLLVPKLTPDVILLADNVISHPDEIAGYLRALESLPQFERVVLPVGKGLSVAYRYGGGIASTIAAGA
ncbi:MAG TPA: class I SAM-dependent methyltransferase [Ktedonobacteraceae bacterium]|jgi:predicted O-methyltransferase YrrM|nr:class I SAM-dependent methyltransferase [Ktedonobacteraceae bacterium]